jgi:parallel beta-helix repeat protein
MPILTITYSSATTGVQTVSFSDGATPEYQRAQVQAALDAVAGQSNASVVLSGGTFTVQPPPAGKPSDGCLRISSETTLSGSSDPLQPTVIKLANNVSADVTGIIRTNSGNTLPDGSFTTTQNVRIEYITIDGNKAGNAASANVDGFYCGPKPNSSQVDNNITLSYVTVQNCSRYGFDPHEQTTNLSFLNCTATGNYDGFTIDNCSYVTISNCQAANNLRHGFNVVTGSHHVTLNNITSTNNGSTGVTIQTGDNEIRDWTHDITINGAVVSGNGLRGLDVRQAEGVLISNMDFSGQTSSTRVIVEGCRADPDGSSTRGVDLIGCTTVGGLPLTTANGLSVKNYLQDFGDSDSLNDRWIVTDSIRIGTTPATLVSVTATGTNTTGATLWNYALHDDAASGDLLTGSAGRDNIAAGAGNDTIYGGNGRDSIYGGDGNDNLFGDADNDMIEGNAGNDRIDGGSGADSLFGGAGIDTLIGGTGNDRFTGGAGDDVFRYDTSGNMGADIITDFDSNPVGGQDVIDISGRWYTAAQIGTAITVVASGTNTIVTFVTGTLAGTSITLNATTPSSITASDFVF